MSYKQTARVACILTTLSMLASVGRSDGLIYKLPDEGVWARYEEHIKAEITLNNAPDPKKISHEFTRKLTVKSMERLERHEQMCRWIEVSSEPTTEAGPQESRVLKLLVPEEYLKRGKDPLFHVIKTFFSPSPNDRAAGHIRSNIDGGFNRVQYEIDRVRPVFPKPLSNVKFESRESLQLHGRNWEDCEILTGTTDYDGPLSNDGRMAFESKCRVALHPEAPFGLVSLEMVSDRF